MKKGLVILTVFLILFMLLFYSNTTVGLYEFLHKKDVAMDIDNYDDRYLKVFSRLEEISDDFMTMKISERMDYLDEGAGKRFFGEFSRISLGKIKNLIKNIQKGHVYTKHLSMEKLLKLRGMIVTILKKNVQEGKYLQFFRNYLKTVRICQDLSYGDQMGNVLPAFICALKIENEVHDLMLVAMYRKKIKAGNYRLLKKFYERFFPVFHQFSEVVEKDGLFFVSGAEQYRKEHQIGSIVQSFLGRVGTRAIKDYYLRLRSSSDSKKYNDIFNELKSIRKEMSSSGNLFLKRSSEQVFEDIFDIERKVQLRRQLVYLSACVIDYRGKKGNYPDELTGIKLEKALVSDPFDTAEELKYKLTGNSFLIYSIGVDGKDDSGDLKKDLSNRNYKERGSNG